MNLEEQKQAFDDFTSIMRSTLLKKGNDYFLVRNDSAIVAFKVPSEITDYHFLINASHSDSPALKLKISPLLRIAVKNFFMPIMSLPVLIKTIVTLLLIFSKNTVMT